MIFYLIDAAGNYAGEHVHVKYSPLPERFTEVPPPSGPGYPVWVDGAWELREEPATPKPPVPEKVSRYQVITGMALKGWISEEEAEAALAVGDRPAAVDAAIESLPENQRFRVRMKWIGFKDAYRDDTLVNALAIAQGLNDEEVDDFFIFCDGIK